MTRARSALLATAVAALALPASAPALVPVPQRDVLTANRFDSPQLAALPDGRAALAWTNGTNSGDSTLAMIRPAGKVLPATPQALRGGYSSDEIRFLAGGPAASPLLTWFQDGDSRAPFTVRLDGDQFGVQTGVFSGMYGYGRFPRFARCPDGTTAFAYQFAYPSPTSYEVIAMRRGANGESAGGGSTYLGGSGDYYQDPRPTCDSAAAPLIAWNVDDNVGGPDPGHLKVRGIAGGGTFFDRTVPVGKRGGSPDARIAPDGRLWIVWSEYDKTTGDGTTYVATRAPGDTSAISTASPTVLDAGGADAQLFFGTDGGTHVLLARSNTAGEESYAVRTAPAGSASFGAEQELLGYGDRWARLLTGHPDGAPRLLVMGSDASYNTLYSIQGIPAAGSHEPLTAIDLREIGQSAFAYLPSGDLLGVGVVDGGGALPDTLVEGGLDTGAPPTLGDVSVPGLAAPGEPTPLRIDARDPLGLSSFSWSVDGKTLTDQDTSVTFASPGTYTVTARAVDRAGLATELTRTVRVLDPAPVGQGAPGGTGQTPTTPSATPNDTTKPKLSASAKRGQRGKAARTVTLTLRAGERSAADIELVGTLRRGKDKGTLVLRSKRVKALTANRRTTVRLAVPPSLARLVGNRLKVRVTLTDAAGNRTTKTVTVKKARK